MPHWNLLLGHAGQNDDDEDATEFWLIEVSKYLIYSFVGPKLLQLVPREFNRNY